jgi:hypothetical protein
MSCFIVSKKEVLVIALALQVNYQIVDVLDCAKKLARINVKSVNARYGEKYRIARFKLTDFNGLELPENAQLAKLADCYFYQCNNCEKRMLDHYYPLLSHYRSTLIFESTDYDAATWGL